ncbi:armadillo repeat-containing protein LFR isoform X1 [Selaginella moellendorffii]|uniref:armadillo repeat-containing protein LFR isoform X1 n=1 Tax=Selaginella moellendorffii TaxID=88036 RepID=UPI000D1C34A2|nr:armadillo repeat-containing protein LFR isoform X1 [Selaginella moellendorffii]|eukprot:XP_024517351.1 armadillo repeat-containing protein LFR isoform X1 [Selaginella moellendorffii]
MAGASVGAGNGVVLGKRARGNPNYSELGTGNAAAASAGSGGAAASGASTAAGSGAIGTPVLTGPTVQVQLTFAEKNSKRIVMALQSGLKSELSWALTSLNVLSFKEKDDGRKDALVKIPGLLDALLHVIDEWRDISYSSDSKKSARKRTLGLHRPTTGFGLEYEINTHHDPLYRMRYVRLSLSYARSLSFLFLFKFPSTMPERNPESVTDEKKNVDWWWDEEGLFNLDEIGRAERQQCAVAASNVLRNFSFIPENEIHMAQHRHCLETLVCCMQDHNTEDEELVTNAVETILNLATFVVLRIFTDPSKGRITEQAAVQAIVTMLESPIKPWHCSAAELLGRLVVNPENEPYLLPFATQIYKRLVDILNFPASDSQAAAIAALYNFAEVNMDCRLRLANERWAVGRLLRIVQTPHPLQEVVRKAALTLESLASEPENRSILLAYEHTFAELALTDARTSDMFARILWELSSRTGSKSSARGVWGS